MFLQTICILHTFIPFALSSREYIFVQPATDLLQSAAEDYCSSTYPEALGHLASIESEETNDAIAALCFDSPARNDGCYIGLFIDQVASATPQWTDESAVTYTNWKENPNIPAPEQPVLGGRRGAVIIKPGEATGGGKWRTAKDIGFPFICQKDGTIPVFNWEANIFGDRLLPDARLYTGEALVSANRRYVAVLQSDGNFVVYDIGENAQNYENAVAKWATHQQLNTGIDRFVILQGDGNLVLYQTGLPNTAIWASHDYDSSPGMLIMQSDGNLVAYTSGDVAYWDTWGASGVVMNLMLAAYNPSGPQILQASVPLIMMLIAAFTCVLLICVYGIKRSAPQKELEPLMKVAGSYATF
eukprot:432305_1